MATHRLPERFGAGDALLLGAATAQLSRLLAKDRVTSVLRAPFTRFKDDTGYGEVVSSLPKELRVVD